jgi:hypothetical protein
MKIDVTQKHINRGFRKTCGQCPVALALAEAFSANWSHAGPSTLSVRRNRLRTLDWDTPVVARDFMLRFDSGAPVSPFSFDLPIESGE